MQSERHEVAVEGLVRSTRSRLAEPRWSRGLPRTRDRQVPSTEAALPITQTYARGIAKIAFHYLLAHTEGVFTGHESAFDDVRHYISTGDGFENRIALTALPIAEDLRHPGALKYYTHTVQASAAYDEIVVRVQLSAGPAVLPPTWVVRVARNPSYVYTASFGHAFVLTGDTGDGHQGEMSELTSVSHIVLPRPIGRR